MLWIFLFSFAFGKSTPTPKAPPTRAEQILNQPGKTSLLGGVQALPLIRSTIEKQNAFVRAEFDRPELQEKLSKEIGDSIHKLAPLTGNQIAKWVKAEGEIWWLYLEALSYEEGTKAALDFSWKSRRDLFESIRKKALELDSDFPSAEVLAWIKTFRFNPPIDRLLLASAKKRDQSAARLIGLVQNNPFRSVREYRTKLPAVLQKADNSDLEALWTDENAKDLQDFANRRDELAKYLESKK